MTPTQNLKDYAPLQDAPTSYYIDTNEPVRYVVFSDVHGSSTCTASMMERVAALKPDAILLLGDLLYHGPRNPLPEGHDAAECVKIFNAHKDDIVAIRGNCDADVDLMVLDFPLPDRLLMKIDGVIIDMRHGHRELLPDRFDTVAANTVLLCGHRHVPRAETVTCAHGDVHIWNVGSISLPKNGSVATYAIVESGGRGMGVTFTVYSMGGEIVMQQTVHAPV
ncbi:MAG: phosphodiesterase [Pseudomonadota bacterium]